MLRTPAAFTSLLHPAQHAAPLNFVFSADSLLVCDEDLSLPGNEVLAAMDLHELLFQPIGLLEGRYCRASWLPRGVEPIDGFAFRKLRAMFGAMDEALLSVAGRAFQIADWARTHRFCGACGTPTVQLAGERCAKCPACQHMAYPRISPAMMVLVKRGDSILLARHAASPSHFFTALAGFLEAGESAEEAVHREVFEEVGLKVDNIRYFGSQNWPFPHSLMIAFTADYAGGEINIDENEIAEAAWFGPGDMIPRTPPGISIAGHLIAANLPGAPA